MTASRDTLDVSCNHWQRTEVKKRLPSKDILTLLQDFELPPAAALRIQHESLKSNSELLLWHVYIGRGEAQDQIRHGSQTKEQLYHLLPL